MNISKHKSALLGILGIVFTFVFSPAFAAPINFSGPLKFIHEDDGGAIYSGVPIDTRFFLEFDFATGQSSISDGTTVTSGAVFQIDIDVTNNESLDAFGAALVNSLAGTSFVAGDFIDAIRIETCPTTSGVGTICFWVTYVLDPLTFDNESQSNYPPDPGDILASVFDIEETDNQGTIYYVTGLIDFNGPGLDTLETYDNFNAKKYNGCKYCINPDKWIGLQRSGSNDAEMLREIKAKRLRLAQRSWGNSDSDVGTAQGRNRVRFRDSVNFSGVCFTPRVKKYEVNDCEANGATGRVRMRYVGTFFDAVDGVDDGEIGTVYGWFDMIRFGNSGDKKGKFRVQAYADECQDVNCQIDNWSTYDGVDDPDLFFGTVKASKNRKPMCVGYDRASHQLVFSYGNDVRVVNSADHGLPAFAADMLPRNDWHVIETRVDVEDCSAGKVTGFIDGDVDNVKIREYQ